MLSRRTGLPSATEDIGNWTELDLASLVAEGSVIAAAGAMLARPAAAKLHVGGPTGR